MSEAGEHAAGLLGAPGNLGTVAVQLKPRGPSPWDAVDTRHDSEELDPHTHTIGSYTVGSKRSGILEREGETSSSCDIFFFFLSIKIQYFI